MLISIISDTHLPRGSRRLPEPCITRLMESDLIVHAGDFSASPVLGELNALGPPVAAVHGNFDCDELQKRLPESLVIGAAGARLAIVHDAGPARGRLERMRRRFPDVDALVFGHSHIPLHERDGDFQIFNPGSPTERRRSPAHTMGVARVEHGQLAFEIVAVD
ncbi:MAG: YfcE family phosphodiesterase [Thermoleophilaceae bacterium]